MRRMPRTVLRVLPKTLAALLALGGVLAGPGSQADAQGGPQGGARPPHEWIYGPWTGGLFPAADTEGARCLGEPTVIFTRDVVMRAASLDVAYRQRTIETVAVTPNGLEFRFTPLAASIGPLGGRTPPDAGFGCANPDSLRVERRNADEIVFPNCGEFPAPLRRCTLHGGG